MGGKGLVLVRDALQSAEQAIHIGHGGYPGGKPSGGCLKCAALVKIAAALEAVGKKKEKA